MDLTPVIQGRPQPQTKSDSTQLTLTYILIYLNLNQYIGRKLATKRYVAVSNSAFYFCECPIANWLGNQQLARYMFLKV